MRRFEYLIMHIGTGVDIEILATNEHILDQIAAMVDGIVAKIQQKKIAQYEPRREFDVPSGERLGLRYFGLDYKQWVIGWWIIQQLGGEGWELWSYE